MVDLARRLEENAPITEAVVVPEEPELHAENSLDSGEASPRYVPTGRRVAVDDRSIFGVALQLSETVPPPLVPALDLSSASPHLQPGVKPPVLPLELPLREMSAGLENSNVHNTALMKRRKPSQGVDDKPQPNVIRAEAPAVHIANDSFLVDPLDDVLDWLSRSDLGFSRPQAGDLDQIRGLSPCADMPRALTSTSQDFCDVIAEDGGPAHAQEPRAWPPTTTQQPIKASLTRVSAICDHSIQNHQGRTQNPIDMRSEEDEWLSRQQRTGTVGRLVIYATGENPGDDVFLRGGFERPLVVASVRDAGPAAKAGVKAGDRLVSINGKKDFRGLGADAVRSRLIPPIMLVFLGFVGKLQAEVRLTCSNRPAGLSLRHEVSRGFADAPVQICEETVFDPGLASMFMVVDPTCCEACAQEEQHGMMASMFELYRNEANSMVSQALHKVQASERAVAPSVQRKHESPILQTAADAPSKPGGDPGWVDDGTQGEVLDGDGALHDGQDRGDRVWAGQALTTHPSLSPRDVAQGPRASRQLGRKNNPDIAKATLLCQNPCIVYCCA